MTGTGMIGPSSVFVTPSDACNCSLTITTTGHSTTVKDPGTMCVNRILTKNIRKGARTIGTL